MSETTEETPAPPVSEPVPETAPVPAPPAPDPRAEALAALLAAWVQDCIHNSPVSRDTDAVNHLTTNALPELFRRLLTGA